MKVFRLVDTIETHTRAVTKNVFSPNEEFLATCSTDTTIRIHNVNDGVTIKTLRGHAAGITCLDYSKDGKLIATSSIDSVWIWNVEKESCISKLADQHIGKVTCVQFSKDGKWLASCGDDKKLCVYDINNNFEVVAQYKADDCLVDLSFSNDSKKIVAITDSYVKVYDLEDARCIKNFECKDDLSINSVDFSNNDEEKIIFGTQTGQVKLWDYKNDDISTIGTHEKPVNCVRWSSNGVIASASDDGTIQIFDGKGTLLNNIPGHTVANTVCFSSSGKYISTGGKDSIVRIGVVNAKVTGSLKGKILLHTLIHLADIIVSLLCAIQLSADKQQYWTGLTILFIVLPVIIHSFQEGLSRKTFLNIFQLRIFVESVLSWKGTAHDTKGATVTKSWNDLRFIQPLWQSSVLFFLYTYVTVLGDQSDITTDSLTTFIVISLIVALTSLSTVFLHDRFAKFLSGREKVITLCYRVGEIISRAVVLCFFAAAFRSGELLLVVFGEVILTTIVFAIVDFKVGMGLRKGFVWLVRIVKHIVNLVGIFKGVLDSYQNGCLSKTYYYLEENKFLGEACFVESTIQLFLRDFVHLIVFMLATLNQTLGLQRTNIIMIVLISGMVVQHAAFFFLANSFVLFQQRRKKGIQV